MASDPKPGEFYAIQAKAGGLLTTTSRAYGVKAGTAARLALAQKINAHPLNRRFWSAPGDAFERANFPDGIVSFNPEFTCEDPQRRAGPSESKCFARLFIPPKDDLIHPRLGPAVPLPPGAVPQMQANPCEHLDAGCLTPLAPGDINVGAIDERRPVANPLGGIPNRWICSIVAIIQDSQARVWTVGGGTGVRIGPHHVLTAAHVLLYLSKVLSQWVQTPTVAVAVVFGRHGLLAPQTPTPPPAGMSSFGAFLVTGADNFWVPPEWSAAIAKGETPDTGISDLLAFDYGLIRFDPANRCPSVAALGTAPSHWSAARSSTDFSDVKAFWSPLKPGHSLQTAAYPADKPCDQWEAGGPLRDLFSVGKDNFQGTPKNAWLSFDADFAGGMSGSPVWRRVTGRRTDPLLDPSERLVLTGVAGSSAAQGRTYAAALTPFAWDRLRTAMAP